MGCSSRTVRDFAVSVNFDLAHAHGAECVLVALGRDPGAAAGIDRDGELGEGALGREHIRDDADVSAQADELGGAQIIEALEVPHERLRAE